MLYLIFIIIIFKILVGDEIKGNLGTVQINIPKADKLKAKAPKFY